MTTAPKTPPAKVKLKTIQITPDLQFHLNGLRPFFTTDSQAIRSALKLLYMERTGEVEVIRRQR